MKKKNHSMTDEQLIAYNRKLLYKEVNRGVQDPVDRSVFKQSQEEKVKAWQAKSAWKSNMMICFPNPEDRKKHNNPICL